MGRKLTLVAKDEYGRNRAEVTVARTMRWNEPQGKMQRFYSICNTWGCDFGNRSGFIDLPIGKCDGVIAGAYNWQSVV